MKAINNQGTTLYVVTLKDGNKTRFMFFSQGIIEELLNDYNIPYIKVEPNKKYEWNPEKASNYWREKK